VESVEGTVGGSRLVVAGAKGEILIPLASEICRTIDVTARRIVIEPPEGLLDLNA
jgi:ribosomal 30S subunit maturation factor RimM